MDILNIRPLNQTKYYTEEEVEAVLPFLLVITSKAKGQINGLNSQIDYFRAQPGKAEALQQQLNSAVQKWSEKTRRLGGIPLGLFQVKFLKNEKGNFFLWTFPQSTLEEY